jgi:glycerophosphoryl diester phosphodiesterase
VVGREPTTELGCAAVSPRDELCLRTDVGSRAADAGLRRLPWTITSCRDNLAPGSPRAGITSRREYEALAATGVNAVVSDILGASCAT